MRDFKSSASLTELFITVSSQWGIGNHGQSLHGGGHVYGEGAAHIQKDCVVAPNEGREKEKPLAIRKMDCS